MTLWSWWWHYMRRLKRSVAVASCNNLQHWLAVWWHNCNCHLNSTRRITSHHLNLLALNVQLHPIGLPPSLSQQIVESHCQPIDTLQNQQPQCEFHCRIAENQACRSECTPLFGSTYLSTGIAGLRWNLVQLMMREWLSLCRVHIWVCSGLSVYSIQYIVE